MVLPGLSASNGLHVPSSTAPLSRLGRSPKGCNITAVLKLVCIRITIHDIADVILMISDLAAVEVSGTDHFVVDDHIDPLLTVPLLALAVVYHRHVHHLENVCEEG